MNGCVVLWVECDLCVDVVYFIIEMKVVGVVVGVEQCDVCCDFFVIVVMVYYGVFCVVLVDDELDYCFLLVELGVFGDGVDYIVIVDGFVEE